MPELKIRALPTCQEVGELLLEFASDKLDAERRGRVRGHLAGCDECTLSLAACFDEMMDRGELHDTPVPPFVIPQVLLPDPGPRGAVGGWDWSALNRSIEAIRAAAGRGTRVWGAGALAALDDAAAQLRRCFLGSLPVWSSGIPAEAGAAGNLSGAPAALRVVHLDSSWNELPEVTVLDSPAEIADGPVISADGKFRLVVTTRDPRWAGCRLVCSLRLVEGRAVRFESKVEPEGDGWRAELRGVGLPASGEEVAVPADVVDLYLAPE